MTRHTIKQLLLPMLALCMTVALAATAPAQAQTSASLQINFGSTPHWTSSGVTGVRRIHEGEGPGYDMFRYGGYYYAYNEDRWYRSRTARGQYWPIEQRYVPSAFARVPRGHWRHYPSNWSDRDNQGDRGGRGNQGNGNGNGHRDHK